jgi:hypothetical protein
MVLFAEPFGPLADTKSGELLLSEAQIVEIQEGAKRITTGSSL